MADEASIVSSINQYTDHTTGLYARVNLALAADSSSISDHAAFIKDLRSSILRCPLLEHHEALYRGVDLSDRELREMETLGAFYIPSFTSTSSDASKCYAKNTVLCIKAPYAAPFACTVTPEMSRFYADEREVLFACYCAYRLERVESVNGRRFVTLTLDPHLTARGV